ncbi:glycosyltransferase family 4 protein [Jiella sp. MQZ9-1]|uniref:Glycosyltransferase family 4 protein n=1 Tax=Jiella flava TaxID=2816857 RepID=A0A939G0P5_9HYPH|nr:glycosyltransferase family 4 protein [Jiella flava]MBO0663032.1 glycosyltransferase family 4 protein [Jiella flava]MCD2471451.1 glycosyltransferase family 4 protein [Jiella flava]
MKGQTVDQAGHHQATSASPARIPSAGGQRIVVIASLTKSLVNFRLELLRAMVAEGHKVVALAPDDDRSAIASLAEIGVGFQQIPMARTGTNPWIDLKTLATIWRALREQKPDVLLAYTMKPIIYGGLAARWAGVPRRFALFTGFGYVFGEARPTRRMAALRRLSIRLYRAALVGMPTVFAYNDADAEDIHRHGMISPKTRMVMVAGSGVDLDRFRQSIPPSGPPRFLLVARLLREKGIEEFALAAQRLKATFPKARFQILGPFDPSPSGVPANDVDRWIRSGAIDYLGEVADVRPLLTACSVFVLPSYYREGIPRAALEALAVGRAIVTTTAPGCRETVIQGINGFQVEPRSVDALESAMHRLLETPKLIDEMGARSRRIAETRFDVHRVNRALMAEMGLLRPGAPADQSPAPASRGDAPRRTPMPAIQPAMSARPE